MALAGLKDRLANARTNFTRTRDLYGRNGDDKEFAAINAEVRAIQANRERRSQSVVRTYFSVTKIQYPCDSNEIERKL